MNLVMKKPMKLAAVWIDGGIRVYNKHSTPQIRLTHRIAKGDILSVNDDYLSDYLSGEEWEVLECIGTIDSKILKVFLQNKETDEIKTISINE
jgi:hypothetical protein